MYQRKKYIFQKVKTLKESNKGINILIWQKYIFTSSSKKPTTSLPIVLIIIISFVKGPSFLKGVVTEYGYSFIWYLI